MRSNRDGFGVVENWLRRGHGGRFSTLEFRVGLGVLETGFWVERGGTERAGG